MMHHGIWAAFGFGLAVVAALPEALRRRFGEVVRQFDRVFLASLPLVLIAGMSIGLVTWLQTRRSLADFGLESNLPSILMVAVVIETGPILAGLLLAGRIGAGLAAELGTMALTEELDAREVMGTPAEQSVVAPRVLACLLAAPPLTVLLDAAAFGGALVAEVGFGRASAEAFLRRSFDFLGPEAALFATLKTAVFGGLIGLIGCWQGVRIRGRPSAEAVGHAATRGVVAAMLAVLLSNLGMVPYIQLALAWVEGPH